ncbi:hypothetical protein NAC44_00050 [Allorhizobium sp. BGMRC 0089]|uniref:hypothetical protein n=1 Tax=Allorhizobium sonneratiae TaxID=2934936 RepID=UPI00203321E0|nr:hypothetical protein [Allorhizobium sonneratiae]MCM2290716.1 hypothetical protein [Allorhizobium sonneratiae]
MYNFALNRKRFKKFHISIAHHREPLQRYEPVAFSIQCLMLNMLGDFYGNARLLSQKPYISPVEGGGAQVGQNSLIPANRSLI